tara:strand:+ start:26 stop:889 length:864 start_codon:yes stop_codon:yes gene_type:complete
MSKLKRPDFLIIGVQKSATTWLQKMLMLHPDIYMPNQEVHYFDNNKNFLKGHNWYSSFFKDAKSTQLIGEKTPDYIWTNCSNFPQYSHEKHIRIKEFNPNIKLISVFRNPVDRFISAFHHHKRRGRIPSDLQVKSLFNEPIYSKILLSMLDRGLYGLQLETFYNEFYKDQMKILLHDDVKNNPTETLSDVFSFLGVSNVDLSDYESKRHNVYRATRLGSTLARKSNKYFNKFILRLDKYFLNKLPIEKVKYPQLSFDEKQLLINYYKKDVLKFESLIEKDLPDYWKN